MCSFERDNDVNLALNPCLHVLKHIATVLEERAKLRLNNTLTMRFRFGSRFLTMCFKTLIKMSVKVLWNRTHPSFLISEEWVVQLCGIKRNI